MTARPADPSVAPREAPTDDFRDDDDDDGPEPGEECGRWSNGKLMRSCSKGGSEECDFECPYR